MASKKPAKPKKQASKKTLVPVAARVGRTRKTRQTKTKASPAKSSRPVLPLLPRIRKCLSILGSNKRVFGITTLIYATLYFVFVRVLTNVEFQTLQDGVIIAFGEGEGSLLTQIATIGTVFGESTNLDNQSGLMYAVITVLCSMAFIWLMRKITAGNKTSVKEAFYLGMYPIVPYALMMFWVIINAIPFSLSAFVFQTALTNGLTITFIEKLFFVSIFATGTLISAYFILGTVIGSYAVTVPGVTPTEARRSARGLLKGRRIQVLRQAVLFLMLTAATVVSVMLLFVWLWQAAVIVMAALVLVMFVPWFHLYFYHVYLELLHE